MTLLPALSLPVVRRPAPAEQSACSKERRTRLSVRSSVRSSVSGGQRTYTRASIRTKICPDSGLRSEILSCIEARRGEAGQSDERGEKDDAEQEGRREAAWEDHLSCSVM